MTCQKRNIALVIYALGLGGAERNVVQMAGYWAAQGHKVTIVTMAGAEIPVQCEMPEGVGLVRLGVDGASQGIASAVSHNIRRIRALRRAFRSVRPHMAVSFMETANVVCLLAAAGTKTRVVISDRNDPQREYYGPFWRILRNLTYPFAYAFVVQTRMVRSRYPRRLAARASTIPNPVAPDISVPLRAVDESRPRCICLMGRLVRQKGFDLLLDAFAPVAREFPGWFIAIWGEGPERDALEAQAVALEISDRVKFMGLAPRPAEALAAAGIFVLPSRWEGFPNVLLEAMAAGLPVIAADCPSGPGEIIEPGRTGLLVPAEDVTALRNALRCLLKDEDLRQSLGQAARDTTTVYELNGVMARWDAVLGLSGSRKEVA